jgi:CcmD family protein
MDARNFTYMFYGFAAAWVILALYVLTLVFRERALRSQMDTLKRMVEPKEGPRASNSPGAVR